MLVNGLFLHVVLPYGKLKIFGAWRKRCPMFYEIFGSNLWNYWVHKSQKRVFVQNIVTIFLSSFLNKSKDRWMKWSISALNKHKNQESKTQHGLISFFISHSSEDEILEFFRQNALFRKVVWCWCLNQENIDQILTLFKVALLSEQFHGILTSIYHHSIQIDVKKFQPFALRLVSLWRILQIDNWLIFSQSTLELNIVNELW